jgi:hypothetical protein
LLAIDILGVYGNIKPPASFNGDNTGLVWKLDQLAKLNLTRQSLGLASLKADTALIMSPTASPAAGKLIARIAPAIPFGLSAPELMALAKFLSVLTPDILVPIKLVDAPSVESKLIILSFGVIFS